MEDGRREGRTTLHQVPRCPERDEEHREILHEGEAVQGMRREGNPVDGLDGVWGLRIRGRGQNCDEG